MRFSVWGSDVCSSDLGMPILAILPFSQDRLIIGTATNGLYLYDGTSFIPWKTEASRFLKNYQLNNGIISSRGYVFGTIQNGVIIIDEHGRIMRHFSQIGRASCRARVCKKV